jgi:altronate dehydratase
VDRLVAAGGTAVLGETPEIHGLRGTTERKVTLSGPRS